jgi:hypothetical protein
VIRTQYFSLINCFDNPKVNMPLIIALVGTKGVGKTTISEHLVSMGFTEVAFADTLKESVSMLLGLPRAAFDNPESKERPMDVTAGYRMTPRQIMQQYGDCIKELFGPDVLIDSIRRRLLEIQTPVIISDVRYQHEAEFVKGLGARLYRVVLSPSIAIIHDRNVNHTRGQNAVDADLHGSETSQRFIVCDSVIYNDGKSRNALWMALETEFVQPMVVENPCLECGVDMGSCNPRQLCGKTHCDNDYLASIV